MKELSTEFMRNPACLPRNGKKKLDGNFNGPSTQTSFLPSLPMGSFCGTVCEGARERHKRGNERTTQLNNESTAQQIYLYLYETVAGRQSLGN